jgi:hypothetical protein
VSVVALHTNVSVDVGKVNVQVLEIVLITGLVSVLLVIVWVSVVQTTVQVGAVLVAQVSKSASQACTSVQITSHKVVLCAAAFA